MNNRDKPDPTPGRARQARAGQPGASDPWDMPRQSEQWQAGAPGQFGGDWEQPQRGAPPDRREYRFSGNAGPEPLPSAQAPEREDMTRPSDPESRDREPRREYHGGYPQRFYDAAYGNDFASFTSEDYGGRDFYASRSGHGGMSPGGGYRPDYGISHWFRADYGDDERHARDYGAWRAYGERRGFLARASDEVASWFGNHEAAHRREQDHALDHRGRGPSNYTRSDERILDDANDMLTHDRYVDASNITVSVSACEVTLDGTVDSREAKRRAEDCVDGIAGVRHVQNNLRVEKRR